MLRRLHVTAWGRAIVPAVVVLCVTVIVAHAWLADDAFITLRTIDNFVAGDGLRWNTSERVMASTHPLWLLVASVPYAVTREPYFTTLGLSLAISAGVAVVLARSTTSSVVAATGLLAVTSSKAFIDYSTSGLENPLSHLVLVLFVLRAWSGSTRPPDLRTLSLVAAAAMLNRLDLALLVAPFLVRRMVGMPMRSSLPQVALGLLPLAAWLVFSVLYYGSPFPNTAYAKLNTGVESMVLWQQGIRYLADSIQVDYVTMPIIIAGILLPSSPGQGADRALRLGMVLYLSYIVSVGGDFMSGRLLTPVFIVSVLRVMRALEGRSGRAGLLCGAACLVVGGLSPGATIFGQPSYEHGEPLAMSSRAHGINDERRFYWQRTGLWSPNRSGAEPRWEEDGRRARREKRAVVRRRNVGIYGYYAGPDVHIVDPYALADPLLARLPAMPEWRIGHYQRLLPHGYRETLESGQNVIKDPGVSAYYDHLSVVTRGPLWSRRRARVVGGFLLGTYDHLLNDYRRGLESGADVGVQ